MGPEASAAMMLLGTAMQMQAAEEQKDDRRRLLNQQLDRDEQATKKAVNLVQDESGNYTLANRQEALQAEQGKTFDQIQADVQGAGGASVSTASDAGNVSEDFLKTKAARAIDEGTRLTSIAREAAKSRAPTQLMGTDALRRAGMAGELQSLWGTNNNMGRATANDAEGVQQPMYGSLGTVASSLGAGSLYGNPDGVNQMMTRWKYSGSSNVPTAANYVNSMDAGGINFGPR